MIGPSATVYFWLGLLHDQNGSATLALDYYRKALYLDPSHVEAMGHLSLLLAARRDHAGARALRLRANASNGGGAAHEA